WSGTKPLPQCGDFWWRATARSRHFRRASAWSRRHPRRKALTAERVLSRYSPNTNSDVFGFSLAGAHAAFWSRARSDRSDAAILKGLELGHSAAADLFRASPLDRKSTRLNSSHVSISYAVFCLKKKT